MTFILIGKIDRILHIGKKNLPFTSSSKHWKLNSPSNDSDKAALKIRCMQHNIITLFAILNEPEIVIMSLFPRLKI